MTRTIHGKVRGKIIELDEDLGVADGQEVEVQVRVLTRRPHESRGRDFCAPRGPWPMIRSGMPSWRKSTRPGNGNDGRRPPTWGNYELPPGHGHSLSAHTASGEAGPSV